MNANCGYKIFQAVPGREFRQDPDSAQLFLDALSIYWLNAL